MARRRSRDNRSNGNNRNIVRSGDSQAAQQPSARRASRLPAGAIPRPIPSSVTNQVNAALTGQSALTNGSQWNGQNDQPISVYASPTALEPAGPGSNQANAQNVTFPPGDPLRPVAGFNVRQWMYPVGGNITPTARATEATSFETLRNLAAMYSVIGLCEMAHFRILERLSLRLTPRQELLDAGEDQTADKWTRPARQMQEWFEEGPDKRGGDLTSWMIAFMKDWLEIDAVAVLNRPTRDGRLHSLDLIAGDTIALRWDTEGRAPIPPVPAYQQILYGAPGALFTVANGRLDGTELDYLVAFPRTNSPYGTSPVERIILTINAALRKRTYDLTRYTDGATPEGVVQTSQPELFKMTVDQVMAWEEMWNAALAGNDAMRHRTKFVPPGFQFTSTEQAAIATEYDEMLFNETVSAFGLTKDELGFTDTSNRSVGQSQEAVTYRQAIMPRSSRLAAYFTKIIRRYDGKPLSVVGRSMSAPGSPTKDSGTWDARFIADWTGIEEPEDFTTKTNAYATLVGAGIVGRTEAKRALNLPIGKGEVEIPPMILAPAGPDSMVILEDLVAQRDQINKAHKAGLDSKIAGAQAAEEQFKNGGNPVMAAGMAAANLNAGAKQQVAAGGASGGQHAQGQNQQQSPAQAQQTPNPRQNTGGQGRSLAQRADDTDDADDERGHYSDEDRVGVTARGDAHQARPRPGESDGWDVAESGDDAMGRFAPDFDAAADVAPGGTALRAVAGRGDGRDGAGGERGRLSEPAATGLLRDGDTAGVDLRPPAARGNERGDGEVRAGSAGRGDESGARVTVRGGQSLSNASQYHDDQFRHRANGTSDGHEPGRLHGTAQEARREASPEEVSDEWARYRERAIKDTKRGKSPRPFVSDLLPTELHRWVAHNIDGATSPDVVRAVFAEAREREERALREAGVASVEFASSPPSPTPVVAPSADEAPPDPLAALAQALVARLEATALSEQRSTLRELRADVSAALRY